MNSYNKRIRKFIEDELGEVGKLIWKDLGSLEQTRVLTNNWDDLRWMYSQKTGEEIPDTQTGEK